MSMEVGERPEPVAVTVPSGYEHAAGDLQVEVSDPHRVGEGMSKHVEYKVTYWTTLPRYKQKSGCVTRRYSDFEWLWKMLRSSMDGVIVPPLPQKTLMANDDPTSAAIERRRHNLAVFVARVAAHPVMRTSSDLQIFLEEQNKASWSVRVPWYERGVTSDALKGVTDWFQSTVRLDDVVPGGLAAAAALNAAAGVSPMGSGGWAGAGSGGGPLGGGTSSQTDGPSVANPGVGTGATGMLDPAYPAPLPPPPQSGVTHGGDQAGPSDGIAEKQHFLEVANYISTLKLRVDKLLLATSALVKHSAHTSGVLMQFAAIVSDLDEAEAKATALFYSDATAAALPTEGEREHPRVQWTEAARLFSAAAGPPRAQAEAVSAAFQEPLEAAAALCLACVNACDGRKGIVDHYNRLCRQIERLDNKVATMGIPEPGPKREEKQKVELAASDLRIARTQAAGRYERCCECMEHELLWFHTELARTLGAALKALVAAQGAAAGRALHACQGHVDPLRAMLANPPAAMQGR